MKHKLHKDTLMLLLVAASAVTVSGQEVRYVNLDGIQYQVGEGIESDIEAVVFGIDGLKDVVIPATIEVDGKPIKVIRVEQAALSKNSALRSIVFGANISTIPRMSQSQVESVKIEGEVTHLYPATFSKCASLKEIELPATLSLIGPEAFQGCAALASISLPENLKNIGWNAFSGSGLRSIAFPETLRMIDEGAFSNCTKLTDIDFGKGVTIIGHYAFKGCVNLKALTLPENIVSVGKESFSGCGIKYVTFGNMSYSPVVSLESAFGTSEFPYTQAISFDMVGDFPNPYPALLDFDGKRHLTVDSTVPVYLREATDDASVRWPVGKNMVVSMSGAVNSDDPEAFPVPLILTFASEGEGGLKDITVFYNGENVTSRVNDKGELVVDRGFVPKKTGTLRLQPVNLVRVVKIPAPDIFGVEAVDSDKPIDLFTAVTRATDRLFFINPTVKVK